MAQQNPQTTPAVLPDSERQQNFVDARPDAPSETPILDPALVPISESDADLEEAGDDAVPRRGQTQASSSSSSARIRRVTDVTLPPPTSTKRVTDDVTPDEPAEVETAAGTLSKAFKRSRTTGKGVEIVERIANLLASLEHGRPGTLRIPASTSGRRPSKEEGQKDREAERRRQEFEIFILYSRHPARFTPFTRRGMEKVDEI